MLEKCPGSYLLIGNGDGDKLGACMVHNPGFVQSLKGALGVDKVHLPDMPEYISAIVRNGNRAMPAFRESEINDAALAGVAKLVSTSPAAAAKK